jgi:hypothetical protein
MRMTSIVGILAASVLSAECGIIGPSCLGQQQRRVGESIVGYVEAGATTMHLLTYDVAGSENDIAFDWNGRLAPQSLRLRAYATRAGCVSGPVWDPGAGDCTILSAAGSHDGIYASNLTVTHGRGNPNVLGTPPAFKIWVFGDPNNATDYVLRPSSFLGPDC